MAAKTVRCSFSLPIEIDADLREVSEYLGVTRSSMIASMLRDALPSALYLTRTLAAQGVTARTALGEDGRLSSIAQRAAYDALDLLESRAKEVRDALDS